MAYQIRKKAVVIGLRQSAVFMYRHNDSGKVAVPVFQAPRLFDQCASGFVFFTIACKPKNLICTGRAFFLRLPGRGGTMRHPRKMEQVEVEAFLIVGTTPAEALRLKRESATTTCSTFSSAPCLLIFGSTPIHFHQNANQAQLAEKARTPPALTRQSHTRRISRSPTQRSTVLFHRAFQAGRFSLITSQSTVTAVFI